MLEDWLIYGTLFLCGYEITLICGYKLTSCEGKSVNLRMSRYSMRAVCEHVDSQMQGVMNEAEKESHNSNSRPR